jgi:ribose transport system permease protein
MTDHAVEEKPVDKTQAPAFDAPRRGSFASGFLNKYAVVLVLVAMVVVFSILRPDTFFTLGNFTTLANSQAVLLILSLALILPLSVGEFDLSVASGLGFGAVLTGFLNGELHWPLALVIALVFVVGAIVGTVNAIFIVHFGVNAFIVTLGTGTVLTGLTIWVSGGQILSGISPDLINVVTSTVGGLALPFYIAIALTFALWYVYEYTPLGRYLTFVGLGAEVARLAGLPIRALRFGAFIVAGIMAAGCGVLAVGLLGSADPSAGASYLLPAYAGAFLGTTVIKPGRFNAWGTAVALALLVVGVTGLQLLGAAGWVEQVFNGAALILAVTFARLVSRQERS